MTERVRRYIPSFKRRRIDGDTHGSRSSFWDGSEDYADRRDGSQTDASRDMDVALARMRQLQTERESALLPQRYRRRRQQLVKRQEPDGEQDPNEVRDVVDEILGGQPPAESSADGSGGVTVTVSIGLSLQITTISSGGTTFVSTMSTSWFTFDASGNISSSLPTATPESESTSSSATAPTSPTSPTSISAPTTNLLPSSTLVTVPTPTSTTSEESVTAAGVPDIYSTSTLTSVSSLISSLAPNMTDYSLAAKTRTTKPTVTITETKSSKHSSLHSTTRISTSITATTTIFPADSEPTTPLESPTSTLDSSDGTEASASSGTSVSERLPPILGGVFGGIAGLGLVLWALLFILRKQRRKREISILGRAPGGGHQRAISQDTGAGSVGEMSQPRNSFMPGLIAAGAGLFSGRSSADTAAVPPAERGFVKIAGRKLPSMYGDDMIPTSIAIAGARASASEPGSRNVSGGTHPTAGASGGSTKSFIQDDEIMHAPVPFPPSTARTAMKNGSPALVSRIIEDEPEITPLSHTIPPPIHNNPGEGNSRFPTPPPGAVRRMHSLIGPDGVGRSLASQDGSKTSRFTEDV